MAKSGSRMVLIDARTAGVAGDMVLGALIDLGASVEKIRGVAEVAASRLHGCRSTQVTVEDVHHFGVRAKRVDIESDEDYHHREGRELIDALEKCLDHANVSPCGRQLAHDCLMMICETEAALHSSNPENVELHEMGSVDTLIDIAGTFVALDELDLLENTSIFALPVNVGGGKVKTSHGVLSAPTFDATEILKLRGFPFELSGEPHELATPTGVSLLVHMAKPAEPGLQMKPTQIGYGAGTIGLKFAPNILRIIVGETWQPTMRWEAVKMLETNVDDVTPEIVGHTLDRLLKEGARDAWVTPIMAKKNRPGLILSVLADDFAVDRLAEIVARETGTLGIRISTVERKVLDRETVAVNVDIGGISHSVRVKVARNTSGEITQLKAEFEDAKELAERMKTPLRHVLSEIERKARQRLGA